MTFLSKVQAGVFQFASTSASAATSLGVSSAEWIKSAAGSWIWDPIVNATRFVYFNGPSKLGFWHGVSPDEACAHMTRVPSDVWQRETGACETLLAKDFQAVSIGCALVGGVLVVWKLLDVCMWSCAFRQLQRVADKKML